MSFHCFSFVVLGLTRHSSRFLRAAELRTLLIHLLTFLKWGKSLRGLIIRMAPVKDKADDGATEDALE